MPELPEVEVVRRGLEKHVVGRTIEKITVLHRRPIRSHLGGPEGFASDLMKRGIDAVARRGKYLWLVLGDDAMIAHLGMSGQFRVSRPHDPQLRNTRVLFDLDDGTQLRFVDQRIFGGLEFVPRGGHCPVPHIALDPFDPRFDPVVVAKRIRGRRTTVKRAILDQKLVSGIGNIYADESGSFERGLDAYGREDQPCRRCATPVVRRRFANRSSFLCPRCQRLPKS